MDRLEVYDFESDGILLMGRMMAQTVAVVT